MAQKKKFYAVRCGYETGIYQSWEECRVQVEGYSNANYKSFSRLKDAEEYLGNGVQSQKLSSGGPVETHGPTSTALPPAVPQPSVKDVVIYADGACTGNPGPGGYGVVLIHGIQQKELAAGFRLTTNNRMEILGCIVGL